MIEEKRKVRGTLKKQLYEQEEGIKQKKKLEAKKMLDQQIQQRRKIKLLQIQKSKSQQQIQNSQKYDKNYQYEVQIPIINNKKQNHQVNRKTFPQSQNHLKYQQQTLNKEVSNVPSEKNIPLLNLNKQFQNSNRLTNKNQKVQNNIDQYKRNEQSDLKSNMVQQQNKKLREEISKNNLAIEFMMGVMKTHSKFDRYRQYAEKILNNKDSDNIKQLQNEKSKRFLPLIKSYNHKSLLHERLKNGKNKQEKQNKKISNYL